MFPIYQPVKKKRKDAFLIFLPVGPKISPTLCRHHAGCSIAQMAGLTRRYTFFAPWSLGKCRPNMYGDMTSFPVVTRTTLARCSSVAGHGLRLGEMARKRVNVDDQRVEFVIRALCGKKSTLALCWGLGISRPTGYLQQRHKCGPSSA